MHCWMIIIVGPSCYFILAISTTYELNYMGLLSCIVEWTEMNVLMLQASVPGVYNQPSTSVQQCWVILQILFTFNRLDYLHSAYDIVLLLMYHFHSIRTFCPFDVSLPERFAHGLYVSSPTFCPLKKIPDDGEDERRRRVVFGVCPSPPSTWDETSVVYLHDAVMKCLFLYQDMTHT